MGTTHNGYRCTACDTTAPRWVGRCPGCGAWNTLAGATGRPPRSGPGETRPQPVPIGQVASGDLAAHPTGL
ncbi:MAG: DNA repair protein RadA, partial [Acidimicrobiales bacterium]